MDFELLRFLLLRRSSVWYFAWLALFRSDESDRIEEKSRLDRTRSAHVGEHFALHDTFNSDEL